MEQLADILQYLKDHPEVTWSGTGVTALTVLYFLITKLLALLFRKDSDLDSKLRDIAGQYKELLARLETVQSEDSQVLRLKGEARQAIEAGDYAEAEDLLNQADARDVRAIKGIIVGLIFFIIASPFLFWNKSREVKTYEGSGAVVSVPADRVDPAKDGKLVHVTGRAATEVTLRDPVFGVSANALKLRREVEMYQWQEHSVSETRKKLGGGAETMTTYSYSKEWADRAINSSSFKLARHENPSSMPYKEAEQLADKVTLGAFTLPTSLVRKIGRTQQLPMGSDIPLPEALSGRAQRHEGGLYIGKNPASPQIGDVRIRFETVPQQDISVVAQQSGSTFRAYQTKAGESIELLQEGIKTADAMFE